MPSGPKKRKATKRKNDEVTFDIHQDDHPTDPNANPNSGFFSPLHPPQGNWRDKRLSLIEDDGDETFETPRFQPQTPRLPETPYYSMENMGSGKTCGIEGPVEGLSAEIPSKEMKLDESVGASTENSSGSHQEISSEEGEEGGQDDEASQEAKFDESVHVTKEESLKGEDAVLEKPEESDKYVPVDEERTPKVLIESVDVLSSNEKDVKVAMLADNGDVNVDDEDHFESEGCTNFRRNVERELRTNKLTFADNVDLLAERENAPQIDMDMTNNKLEKSVGKSSVPEELSQGNKAYQENAAEPSSHVGKNEAAQRNEAARGPVVARRATFWNCCGLLEVFTSPDR